MKSEDEVRRLLSEKFEGFETTPKDDSWERIRVSISGTDQQLKAQLSAKFRDYTVKPTADSWNLIKENINKDPLSILFSEKLQDFEPSPNEDSWNFIKNNIFSEDTSRLDLIDKFSGYEAEPKPETWQAIKEAIEKKKKRRGIIIPMFYRVGIAASVALLVGSFWWFSNQNENISETKKTQNTDSQIVGKGKIKSKIKKAPEINNHLTESNPTFAENSAKKTVFEKKNLFSEKQKNEIQILETQSNTENNIVLNQAIPNQGNQSKITEIEVISLNINQLENTKFQSITTNKTFRPIVFNPEAKTEEIEIPQLKRANPIIFTANLMPVQNYQVYTILPQTSAYIQQIGKLNAIDNKRLGVQANVGLMKPISKRNTLGASLTYSGIQQYANYEVDNGNYSVQFTDNQAYTVTKLTENINELQFIQALGLKLENSFLLYQKKQKIYLTGGAEAMRVLSKNQMNYFVNASLAVEYPIGNKSVWIEPTFRYSLSKTSDNLNFLQIQPYQVGLNLRYNFTK